MSNLTIEMTRDEALKFGLLTCKHCGLPPNNHFGDGEPGGKCAHRACPGYEEKSRVGKLLVVCGCPIIEGRGRTHCVSGKHPITGKPVAKCKVHG